MQDTEKLEKVIKLYGAGCREEEVETKFRELIKKSHPDNDPKCNLDEAQLINESRAIIRGYISERDSLFEYDRINGKKIITRLKKEFGRFEDELSIPGDVDIIDDYAFWGERSTNPVPDMFAKRVVIPKSIRLIGDRAFRGCVHIEEIIFEHGITDELTILSKAFSNCRALKSVRFPEKTILDSSASDIFEGCTRLEELEITSSEIPFNLGNCKFLKKVKLNPEITTLPNYMFIGCVNLENIYGTDNMTRIGNSAFEGCEKIEIIELPSVESLGDSSFRGCIKLREIEMPKIKKIGDRTFSSCNTLSSIRIPNTVTHIGSQVFSYCKNLIRVIIDEKSAGLIEDDAFEGCSKTKEEIVSYNLGGMQPLTCNKEVNNLVGIQKVEIPIEIPSDSRIGAVTLSSAFDGIMTSIHSIKSDCIVVNCNNTFTQEQSITVSATILTIPK